MADQRINLRSVASEAFYFVDGVEEVRIDVIVFNNTSGLETLFVMPRALSIRFRGIVLNAEFLQLVLDNGNANGAPQQSGPYGGSTAVPANRANFPFFPRKPRFQAILHQTFSATSRDLGE